MGRAVERKFGTQAGLRQDSGVMELPLSRNQAQAIPAHGDQLIVADTHPGFSRTHVYRSRVDLRLILDGGWLVGWSNYLSEMLTKGPTRPHPKHRWCHGSPVTCRGQLTRQGQMLSQPWGTDPHSERIPDPMQPTLPPVSHVHPCGGVTLPNLTGDSVRFPYEHVVQL
jgi:hypothetical protein